MSGSALCPVAWLLRLILPDSPRQRRYQISQKSIRHLRSERLKMFYIGPIEGARVGRQMDGDSWVTSDVRCQAVHYGITINISNTYLMWTNYSLCILIYKREKSAI